MTTRVPFSIACLGALALSAAPPAGLAREVGSLHAGALAAPDETSPSRFLERIEGEWEGKVLMRRDGAVSVSACSASFRPEAAGRGVSGVYEGFAFGAYFEGAASLEVEEDGSVQSVWLDGARDRRVRERLALSPGGKEARLASEDPRPDPAQRHVVRFDEEGRLIVEWVEVMADGTSMPGFRMTLERLERGRHAGARALFETGEAYPRVRRSVRASVPE